MKLKFYFSPSDFEARGQMIISESVLTGSNNFGSMSNLVYKVGYIQSIHSKLTALISLSDGMIIEYESIDKLCDFLNNDTKGFRPMTIEEIHNVMDYTGNRFDN